jgi:hypothetical protein
MPSDSLPVTIRPAREADDTALSRLATLDSATVPAGPVLVAEIDGELVAALGVHSGAVVADPFVPTSEVVELLATRARRLAPRHRRRPLAARRQRRHASAPRVA